MNTSLGYSKKTLTNSNVLLSGGGDKALSEFIGSLNWDSTNKKLQYKSASSTNFTDLITFGSNAFTSYSGYNIAFLNNAGTTVDTFKALTSPSKTLKAGTNVQMTAANNIITITATDTWNAMTGATSSANGTVGYVNATPPKDGYNTKFLRADGTWSVPAYPTKSSWNYNDMYVSSLTTSGNSLRWVKNGSNNDITIPYATSAGSVAWANVSSKPTTLSGYGITDGLYSTQVSSTQTNVTWAINLAKTTRRAFIYNTSGTEWSYLFGLSSSNTSVNNENCATYGVILKMTYADRYLRMIRVHGGKWYKTDGTLNATAGATDGVDWEKIYAGYADSAGSVTWANVSSKPATATRWPSWSEVTGKPSTYTPSSHTHSYLPLAGGTMTGAINWGAGSTREILQFTTDGTWKSGLRYSWSNSTTISLWSKHKDTAFVWHAGTDAEINGHGSTTYDFRIRRESGTVVARIAGNTVWHAGNDGSGSGLDADTLDGYHATCSNTPWGSIPYIYENGWMDVGNSFEMHYDNTTGSDYSTRLYCTGNHSNSVALPSASGTLALTSECLERLAWWNETDTHDVNDLRCGTTFAYSTHGAPSAGTIAAFCSKDQTGYTLQISSSYSGNNLYFRNRNGDNSTWGSWKRVVEASELGSYLPLTGGVLSASSDWTLTVSSSSVKTYISHNGGYGIACYSNTTSNSVYLLDLKYNDVNRNGNGTTALRVTGDGKIGVGTDSPSYKLHVNGTFYASDNSSIGGNLTATNFYTTSDRAKKQNISSFSEHIRKFQLKDTEKWHYGVIAQEVEEMFRDGEEGNMTVNYNSVLSFYIGQLENRVKELEDKLKKYEDKFIN